MIILNEVSALKKVIDKAASENRSMGFVPTMGALHAGHLSLINSAKKSTDITICSIFVNPVQFNDPKDYEKYPVTIEKDVEFLENAGTDFLFLPSVSEMYPGGTKDLEHYDLGYLESILEGKYRPGHFQGVAQVMARLLDFTEPDQLFMGQKDYQQCMVVQKLIDTKKLKTRLVICPTIRESDGLAMSSRNLRLNSEERKKATAIFEALRFVKANITEGDLAHLEIEAAMMLSAKGFKVDYLEIAKADDLELLNEWNGRDKLVVLTAAFLNEIRLIDNILIDASVVVRGI